MASCYEREPRWVYFSGKAFVIHGSEFGSIMFFGPRSSCQAFSQHRYEPCSVALSGHGILIICFQPQRHDLHLRGTGSDYGLGLSAIG